jgi:D-alanine-D-alanine ligase
MKIAVLYNSTNAQVLQRRGPPAYEVLSPKSLQRIVAALQANHHEVMAIEADRHLMNSLESFFGPVPHGQWPGLVFNLAYGIQGEARYAHVPGILEMLGLPYLGSGPLAHALATDKFAAKSLFHHHGLPTADFMLVRSNAFVSPDLGYPLVVKPMCGALSVGLRLVDSEQALRTAVADNLATLGEPVLLERFVAGREINVGVLGNQPAEALPAVEVVVGDGGPPIYTFEDKHGTGTRDVEMICPAPIPGQVAEQAQQLALQAFALLNCRDWARVDMRLYENGQLQLLEVNTIPGLGKGSSLPVAAEATGMDITMLVQRLVEIAVERYRLASSTSKRS